MYSQSDIERAVAAGAITQEQAASLRDYVAASKRTPTADEEYLYVLTGFNDIFVTVAVILALIAAAMVGNYIPPHLIGGLSAFAGVFVAGSAWALAEIFTLRRRMALPSIVLTLAFVYAVLLSLGMMIFTTVGPENLMGGRSIALLGALCFLLGGGAAFLHWRRFRVPITVSLIAMLCVGVVACIVAFVTMPTPEELMVQSYGPEANMFGRFGSVMQVVMLLLGLALFLYAMRWDGSDLERRTGRSDVAFWLHASAAAMIVHPLFSMLGAGIFLSAGGAILILICYALFCLVALIVDRRVILITSLAYLLFAFNALIQGSGPVGGGAVLTVLLAAAVLLLLALFWSALRAAVVGVLPEGLRTRVPAAVRTEPHDSESE